MAKITDQEIESARSDIVKVIESYGVVLEKSGKEYRALCPFHNEKSASFTVMPLRGKYCCFGCGAKGDAIQFVMDYAGVSFHPAVNMINGVMESPDIIPREKVTIADEVPEWSPVAEVPQDAPAMMNVLNRKIDGAWHKLTSVAHWEYRGARDELIGVIHRFNLPNSGKEVMPQVWSINNETGELAWRWLSFGKPRPIFGLELLVKYPNASVMIVEGEKTTIAAREILAGFGVSPSRLIVISWPGGAKAIKYVDWSVLSGRKICLWPDADQKNDLSGNRIPFIQQIGTAAMIDIYRELGSPESCKMVIPPSSVSDGWDLADDLPHEFDILKSMKDAVILSEMDLSVKEPEAAIIQAVVAADVEDEPECDESPALRDNPFFRILGYDHGNYYFFQEEKGQVIQCTKSDFSESGLIELASLSWWEEHFSGSKGGINKSMAMEWIMRTANRRGIYDVSMLRGRGAWTDDGRSIFHHGDFLTVDNIRYEICDFRNSKFIYEKRRKFPKIPTDSLTDEDGKRIFDLAAKFKWAKPASAALMAGWVALAPICGALGWRPHIWLTGGAGAGKTAVLDKFIHRLINDMDVYAQGNSTEAGIRQWLNGDAMPVLFEEAESNTEKDSLRVQSIMSLVRQSSTDSQAKTLKGSTGGQATAFHVRSMFCLASIQVNLKQQADMERITVLALRSKRENLPSDIPWEIINNELYELTLDKTLAGRLVRRSLIQLPTTLKNIDTFGKAGAIKFGNQREGDQYGALMAGAWSLISPVEVTIDEALSYIEMHSWEEYREHNEIDDSERALMAIMGAMVKVSGYAEVTVNELIRVACGQVVNGVSVDMNNADAVLARHGIRIQDKKKLIIANHHQQLKLLLAGTPFELDLRSVLLRCRGAEKLPKPMKFSGTPYRCYSIPITDLLDDCIDGEMEF